MSVDHEITIYEGNVSWKDNRMVHMSQNTTQLSKSKAIVRGTILFVFKNLTLIITAQGSDTLKIGRWSYLTIVGKYELKTTHNNFY